MLSKEKNILQMNRVTWIEIILIVLVVFVIYRNSVNAPFVYDDIPNIVENSDIKQLSNIKTKIITNNRMFTFLTFCLNYHFSKLNTYGYHLFNVIIHIITTILLFFLVKKMIYFSYNKVSNFFPFFVSIIFAVHPVNTEVVSYIYNRSSSLSTMFYILSILLFIKKVISNNQSSNLYLLFSIISFICSLLSKQSAVTLPLILLIFDYIFLSDFKIGKVIEKKCYHIQYWIVLFIFLVLQIFYFEKTPESAVITERTATGIQYILTQPWIIIKYLQLLFLPTGLCIDHQIKAVKTIFQIKAIIPILVLLGIFVITWIIYKRKTGNSKIVLFSILWFFITLIPTNIFIVHVGERHLYLSGIGFYLILVTVLFIVLRKELFITHNWVLVFIMVIYGLILGILAVNRNKLYNNPVLLWSDVISKYPDNLMAYNNRATLYGMNGEYDKVISDCETAIKINPNYLKSYINRGNAYFMKKEFGKAISDYTKVIEINPNLTDAYFNRAVVYFNIGEYNKSIQDYTQVIKINPEYIKAYINRGYAYYNNRQYKEALQDFIKLESMGYKIDSQFMDNLHKHVNRN